MARGSASRSAVIVEEARRDVRVWDVPQGKRLDHLDQLGAPPCMRFSRDGRTLITTDWEGAIHLHETGKCEGRKGYA